MGFLNKLAFSLLGLTASTSAMALVAPLPPSGQVPVPAVLALIGAGVAALYLLNRK